MGLWRSNVEFQGEVREGASLGGACGHVRPHPAEYRL